MNNYISMARPSHWFKNVFMLPGIAIASILADISISTALPNILVGILSACLLASANYTVNEWLDADFDRHHPLKKNRPAVLGQISLRVLVLQYVALATTGLILATSISQSYLITAIFFLVMGLAYNINPLRTKDRVYLDVLTESINNPIRLTLGWFTITSAILPPSSLLVAYWMGGAFLMAVKRYAELRLIGDRETAARYRASFRSYTEDSLLISILFYAMTFAFFFGVFMIKYRIELLVSLPLFAVMFAWYLKIGMATDSPAQRPEKLYREKEFMFYVLFVVAVVIVLFYVKWPALNWLLNTGFISTQ